MIARFTRGAQRRRRADGDARARHGSRRGGRRDRLRRSSRSAAAIERFVRIGRRTDSRRTVERVDGAVASIAPGSLGRAFVPPCFRADTIGLGSTGFYPVGISSRTRRARATTGGHRGGSASRRRRARDAGRVRRQLAVADGRRAGSENAHREWWSRLSSAVAYAPPVAAVAASRTARERAARLAGRSTRAARGTAPSGRREPRPDRSADCFSRP